MLDVCDATELNEQRWQELSLRTELPWSWRKYATEIGLERTWPESRRRYARAPLRAPVILQASGRFYAAYGKDISRLGFGLYSPLPLLPKQAIVVELMGGKKLPVRVVRCKRVGPRCFECGTVFETPAPRRRPSRVY
jgi:hypothetical protein